MSAKSGSKLFMGLYAAVLAAALWIVTGGEVNRALFSAIPIIASAEAIVFAMVYATIFYGEAVEE